MSINIVIPCCSLHIQYLNSCIESIYSQTLLPDNIVIVLNEYERYKQDYDDIINNHQRCTFLKENGWLTAGQNRQIGTDCVCSLKEQTNKDIILYHDVDDLMYPNKVEVVKQVFDKYNCDLMVHLYDKQYDYKDKKMDNLEIFTQNTINNTLENDSNNFSDPDNTPTEHCFIGRDKEIRNARWSLLFGDRKNKDKCSKIHHGHVSVKSNIFSKKPSGFFWILKPTGQDVFFVNEVTRVFKNSVIVNYPLTVWIGDDHFRRIGNNIYHKKSKKLLNYEIVDKIKCEKVKIFDKQFAPQKSKSKFDTPKYIKWDFINENNIIDKNDIVVYTDQTLKFVTKCDAKYKIGWILEPPSIHKYPYDYIKDNIDKFDLVLTCVKQFCDLSEKVKYLPNVMSWIEQSARQIYKKNKIVSLIFSNKTKTKNHRFRHNVIEMIKNKNLNVDMFGDIVEKKLENKITGLQDYMFHIVVENNCDNGYYSEKIIDCFMTGTIPIFYGTPDIGKYFDINGIITFNNIKELEQIIPTLNSDLYLKMRNSATSNYSTCVNNSVPEDLLYQHIKQYF